MVPSLDPYLRCKCRVCVTWRRIGTVIAAGHSQSDFRQGAVVAEGEAGPSSTSHRGILWLSDALEHIAKEEKSQKAVRKPGVKGSRKPESARARKRSRRRRKVEPAVLLLLMAQTA